MPRSAQEIAERQARTEANNAARAAALSGADAAALARAEELRFLGESERRLYAIALLERLLAVLEAR